MTYFDDRRIGSWRWGIPTTQIPGKSNLLKGEFRRCSCNANKDGVYAGKNGFALFVCGVFLSTRINEG